MHASEHLLSLGEGRITRRESCELVDNVVTLRVLSVMNDNTLIPITRLNKWQMPAHADRVAGCKTAHPHQ